jgi:hypothetical protein
MSISLVLAVLMAWVVVGAGVAFLFGSFTRSSDMSEDVDELPGPVIKHLRPRKRTAQVGIRAATETENAVCVPVRTLRRAVNTNA